MKDIFLQPIRFIAQKLYARYKHHKKNRSPMSTSTDMNNESPVHKSPIPPQESPSSPKMETIKEEPIVENPSPPSDQPSVVAPESNIEVEYSETPNPNACKYDVSTSVASESFSFSQQEKAKDHPLASAILSIDGIASVFGVHTFITVTKSPQHNWEQLHPQVIQALRHVLS